MAFNDHTDWTWDERVLRMLTSLGQAFAHLCTQLTDCLERFDGYAERYSSALAKVDVGQRRWVDAPELDSCHTTGLGWHIADIIYTWPDLTVDYAITALSDNRHVMEGVDDTIHSVVLRAHTERPGPDSGRAMDAALELLLFLEPELREVLAHELCSIGLAPGQLLDVLSAWKRDGDDGVRKTVVVGVTLALTRVQRIADASGATSEIPEFSTWRTSVREQLRAYGSSMEEDRQNAWIAMLLLGDLGLISGLRETIGEPTEPGVRLSDVNGIPDELLVELVVANWDALSGHFSGELLSRLSKERLAGPKDERLAAIETVKALALAADKHPDVARLVREHLDAANEASAGVGAGTGAASEAALRRAQDDLRVAPGVIEWLKNDSGGDREKIRLLLEASDLAASRSPHRFDHVTAWALPRLLDGAKRDLGRGQLHELLAGGLSPHQWDSDEAWLDAHASVRRTVWALLNPDDPQTQTWLAGLARWFATGPKLDRQPSTWLEVSALCVGATPAADLPAILGRMFYPARAEYFADSLWELTVPLLYRLRHDADAVEALRASLLGDPIAETAPYFAPSGPGMHVHPGSRQSGQDGPDARPGAIDHAEGYLDALGRRVFVTALALKHSGHLSPDDLRAAFHTLRRADPRSVVVDPFANQAGPLRIAGTALLQR